jgi:predicted DNA-binding mobile mystery protein A
VNKREQASRARHMLDTRLRELPSVEQFAPPRAGWIRAIRDALGMSAADLGRRMGVTGATVGEIEANERDGGIRLSTLRRAAEAMDCTVVYALVPRESLESTVRQRAEQILDEQHRHVDQTMRLEAQESKPSRMSRQRQLDEVLRSRNLWSQGWDQQ